MRKIHLRFFIPEVDDANAVGKLFKAFFECYHEDNEFSISEKTLTLNVTFEEIPEKVITAISEIPFSNVDCLQIEEVQNVESVCQDEVQHDASKEENEKEDNDSIQTEQEEKKEKAENQVNKKKQLNRKHQEMDEVGLQILEKIAKESNSFEDFIHKIGEFIGIREQNKGFYLAMLKTACSVTPITMTEIANNMESFGECFSDTKKVAISLAIKKAFEAVGSKARLMTVLEEVVKYKNYNFSDNPKEVNSSRDDEEQVASEVDVSEDNEKQVVSKVNVSGDDEEQKLSQDAQFKTFSEEILNRLYDMEAIDDLDDYLAKFGGITKIDFYEIHEAMIMLIERTAKDISKGKKLQIALAKHAEVIFGDNEHIAQAFIYQAIKNYCKPRSEESLEDIVCIEDFLKLVSKIFAK